MAPKSLGQLLQHTLEDGNPDAVRVIPPRRARRRPPVLFVIAALGSGLVALGMVLLLWLAVVPQGELISGQLRVAGITLLAGSGVLLLSWVSLLGTGYGGVLGIGACVGPPFAVLHFRAHAADAFYIETTIAYVGLGLGVFAGGHLFARGLHAGVRWAAGVSVLFVFLAFSAEAWQWHISRRMSRILYLGAFGGLATTSGALAFNLLVIARRLRRECLPAARVVEATTR